LKRRLAVGEHPGIAPMAGRAPVAVVATEQAGRPWPSCNGPAIRLSRQLAQARNSAHKQSPDNQNGPRCRGWQPRRRV
jgi:hypothetical protein